MKPNSNEKLAPRGRLAAAAAAAALTIAVGVTVGVLVARGNTTQQEAAADPAPDLGAELSAAPSEPGAEPIEASPPEEEANLPVFAQGDSERSERRHHDDEGRRERHHEENDDDDDDD